MLCINRYLTANGLKSFSEEADRVRGGDQGFDTNSTREKEVDSCVVSEDCVVLHTRLGFFPKAIQQIRKFCE